MPNSLTGGLNLQHVYQEMDLKNSLIVDLKKNPGMSKMPSIPTIKTKKAKNEQITLKMNQINFSKSFIKEDSEKLVHISNRPALHH